jgi:hypothetical protein
MRQLLLVPIAAFFFASILHADDGILQQVREQVKPPETAKKPGRPQRKDNDQETCDDSGDGLPDCGLAALALFPFVIPPLAMHDDYQTYSLFPRYPYACGLPPAFGPYRPRSKTVTVSAT